MRQKPNLAISLGDPAGIGPEIVAKNLDVAISISNPIVFGHWPTLKRALGASSSKVALAQADQDLRPKPGLATIVHCGPEGGPIDAPGDQSAMAQFEAIERAVSSVLNGSCDALVTAPVSKALIAGIRPGFTGHTEFLAGCSGLSRDDVTMIFASRKLAIGLVSTHIPLKDAAAAVTRQRLERTFRHLHEIASLLFPGSARRIAVSAINPHAGEDGLIGVEEREILAPFCREMGVEGPLPADVVFRDAFAGRYVGVVAAYHDQATIPIKMAGPGNTVNVTWGLPFVRTSPDHGVAYEIARSGAADPSGMRIAIEMAVDLAAKKILEARSDKKLRR